VKICYPRSVDDISPERSKELGDELKHFLKFSPCQRLNHVEREWVALQEYIKRFGVIWNRNSN